MRILVFFLVVILAFFQKKQRNGRQGKCHFGVVSAGFVVLSAGFAGKKAN